MMAERIYETSEIKVRWQSELCTHCESCWRGFPQVFDPKARPWVKIEAATADEIRGQVNECPSGALSIIEDASE